MSAKYPTFTVSRELPDWVRKGRNQFQCQHGGPAELAKDVLFHWSTKTYSFDDLMAADGLFCARLTPEVVWDWAGTYCEEYGFLDKMAELGKDFIQVTWSCGFSTQSEAIQRKIVTDFTRRAHKRGIKICAYLSLTNIFWKDAFEHEAFLKDLTAKYSDGRVAGYAYSQARYLACISQPGWVDYLKSKVRLAIEEADVDGIYFDNLCAACGCDVCNRRFGDFTERLVGKRYALPERKEMLPPGREKGVADELTIEDERRKTVAEKDDERCRDYLCRMFEAWNIADALKQIRDDAFALKFPLLFSANGHMLPFVYDVCNVLYSEDLAIRGADWDGIPLMRYLAAASEGWKTVSTYGPVHSGDARLAMAQAMAFQGHNFNEKHKPYNVFFREHPEIYADVEPMAKLGVIWEWPKRRGLYLQPLGQKSILYKVIIKDKCSEQDLNKYKVVLVPDLEGVSDELIVALNAYEAGGGTVIRTGKSLCYDEFGRRREGVEPVGDPAYDPYERIPDELVQQILEATNPQYIEVDAGPGIVANLVRKTDGSSYIVHVVNYSGTEVGPVTIRLNIPGKTFSEAMLYSPDDAPQGAPLSLSNGSAVVLEKTNVYSVVAFR